MCFPINKPRKSPKLLRKAGAILITSDDHIILIQNRYQTSKFNGKGSLGLPKGSMRAGESFHECAVREIKEELGISIAITNKTKTRRISGVKFFIIHLNLTKKTFLKNRWLKTNDTYEVCAIIILSLSQLMNCSKYFCNHSLSYFIKLIKYNPEFKRMIFSN